MKCTNCGKELSGAKFCSQCGTAAPVYEAPTPAFEAPVPPPIPPKYITEASIPKAYKPLSPWAYFGYQLLFSLPVIGFILLIVFSLDDNNVNLRNFARSYWCSLAIGLALLAVIITLLLATGLAAQIVSNL